MAEQYESPGETVFRALRFYLWPGNWDKRLPEKTLNAKEAKKYLKRRRQVECRKLLAREKMQAKRDGRPTDRKSLLAAIKHRAQTFTPVNPSSRIIPTATSVTPATPVRNSPITAPVSPETQILLLQRQQEELSQKAHELARQTSETVLSPRRDELEDKERKNREQSEVLQEIIEKTTETESALYQRVIPEAPMERKKLLSERADGLGALRWELQQKRQEHEIEIKLLEKQKRLVEIKDQAIQRPLTEEEIRERVALEGEILICNARKYWEDYVVKLDEIRSIAVEQKKNEVDGAADLVDRIDQIKIMQFSMDNFDDMCRVFNELSQKTQLFKLIAPSVSAQLYQDSFLRSPRRLEQSLANHIDTLQHRCLAMEKKLLIDELSRLVAQFFNRLTSEERVADAQKIKDVCQTLINNMSKNPIPDLKFAKETELSSQLVALRHEETRYFTGTKVANSASKRVTTKMEKLQALLPEVVYQERLTPAPFSFSPPARTSLLHEQGRCRSAPTAHWQRRLNQPPLIRAVSSPSLLDVRPRSFSLGSSS